VNNILMNKDMTKTILDGLKSQTRRVITNPIPNMWKEKTRKDDRHRQWINLRNSTAPKNYKWEDNPYVFVYEFKRVNKDVSDYA